MCRQRIDPAEWDAQGGTALGDRAEWSDRACGMAALRMILLAYLGDAPPLTELVKAGVRDGALTDRGWLHAGIARLAASFGIPAAAEAVTADELPARLAAAPVIISVTEKFPDDGRKGGHLVVARGTACSAPTAPGHPHPRPVRLGPGPRPGAAGPAVGLLHRPVHHLRAHARTSRKAALMIPLALAEIAAITSGTLHDAPDPSAQVTAPAACDSRQVISGGMFAALRGARADGHDFAAQALAAGAVCVLASRPVDGPAVVVPDVTAALGALARHVLSQLTDATVIALTGSSGKTTTKDMLRHVLSQHGPVIAPPGSFNTEIGLPLTVLQAGHATRYLVLEMGTRHLGDIRYLTSLAPPQIGIVLNVGSAHIGEFGSRQAIAQAKGELAEALPDAAHGGVAILNADDPLVAAMAARTAAKIVSYGTSQADIRAAGIGLSAGRPASPCTPQRGRPR